MRLAYLTTQYPSVSHTFIRREILTLESMGFSVFRSAIRPGSGVVDAADKSEAEQTFQVLAQSKPGLLVQALVCFIGRPAAALRALAVAMAMGRVSERGRLKHIAYWLEAGVLYRRYKQEQIDHVHVHFGTNAASVARLARVLGGPTYSMMIHGPDEFDQAIGHSLGAKMEDAAFTVAITDYCAAQLRRWVDYEHWDKIKVVGCTVGEQWFDAAEPVADNAHSLVCVGRLCPQKGQTLLVDAFALALARGAKGKLVLVGDGEQRDAVEERIAACNVADAVSITGWQDEAAVRGYLLASRGLVLGSFAEGLPVVIMEALALQRPVVSTMIMGIPELVQDGVNGWLVPAGNVEQLADAIYEVLTVPVHQLHVMGEAGQSRVRERHLAETEVAKLAAHFRAL